MLTYLIGGEASTLARVKDVLAIMGGQIHHVGARGAGMTMKLAVNALFAIQVASLGEILPTLHRAGIGKEAAVAIPNELPVTSPIAMKIGAMMQAAPYHPNFPVTLVEKDLRYCDQLGKESGGVTPMVKCARDVFERAKTKGLGGDDISGIIQLYEN